MAVLPHFVTDLLAQTPQPGQVNPPLDVTDSIYNANTSTFLGSKNISLTPYRMTEERFSEQGFLKGVGTGLDTSLAHILSGFEPRNRIRNVLV